MDLNIQWVLSQLISFFILLAIVVGISCFLIIPFFQSRKNKRATEYEALEQRVQQLEEELQK
ncbi:hypothetical protein BEP19_00430 [Ammoniphilus oxalaticus]|uniref:DUF4083 domain-containing protein n=1 Tax=Ammoniphilus oxalaticus TaxID=66863 RepID=A0A419SRL2_9BACL|nr:hypothetical protein [Ammoniphilus oxalaticus]RKD27074.1 hypothetical protein BEP19_00430 [Ammoniphilus oxalaticus]